MDETHPDTALATDILQCIVLHLLSIILLPLLQAHYILLLHWVSGDKLCCFSFIGGKMYNKFKLLDSAWIMVGL